MEFGRGVALVLVWLGAFGTTSAAAQLGADWADGIEVSIQGTPDPDSGARVGGAVGFARSWSLRDPEAYGRGPFRRLIEAVAAKVARVRLAPTTRTTPHGPVTLPGDAARFMREFANRGVSGMGGLNLKDGDPLAERTVALALERLPGLTLADGIEVEAACRLVHERALWPAVVAAMEEMPARDALRDPEGRIAPRPALAAHRFFANALAYLEAMEVLYGLAAPAPQGERSRAALERFRELEARLDAAAAKGRLVPDGQVVRRLADGSVETIQLYALPAPG